MRTYEPHPDKLGCHDANSTGIVLRTSDIIDATYHFRTNGSWVCLYKNSRSDGIVKNIPTSRTNTRVEAVHTNCFVQYSSRCSMFKRVGVVRENRCCAVEGGRAVSVCCSVHSVSVPSTSFVHCSKECSLFKENALGSFEVVR